ncbi:MAG: desulfoferrodoxin family protein [Oligoflexales bacterium]
MDRRIFMKYGCLTPGLFGMLASCGEKPEYEPLKVTTLDANREDSETIYTAAAHPEELTGKAGGHLPQITLVENQIQVETPHPMEEEHYIARHQIIAENGEVIADRIFKIGVDSEAKSLFRPLMPSGDTVSALSTCNLHGIWKADYSIADLLNGFEDTTIYTQESPGRWAGKEAGHLPNVSMEGSILLVTTEHAMTEEHYISKHQVIDELGTVLNEKLFNPAEDTDATSRFRVERPAVGSNFIVLSHCNLHGIWQKEFAFTDFNPAFIENRIYTQDDPGQWAGKEAGHIPTITRVGLDVTITTNHAIGAEHYIAKHTLADEAGQTLTEFEFDPANAADSAISTHTLLNPLPASGLLKVYALCNLHGLWQRIVSIADIPEA